MEAYYYVRRIDHNGQPCSTPRTKHACFNSAKKEAKRQCVNSPASQFEILKCVAVAETFGPRIIILDDNDDDLDPWGPHEKGVPF